MNETLKTIKDRRAIRNYYSEQIPDLALDAILNAALHAPSAMNKQNWYFTVIQNKILIDQLSNTIVENVIEFNHKALIKMVSTPHYHAFYNAPTVIIISGEQDNDFIQIAAGAAAQNICLAAESLNIGSCIMTMSAFAFTSNQASHLKETLDIPSGYHHICAVTLGYKAGQIPSIPPRNADVITSIK